MREEIQNVNQDLAVQENSYQKTYLSMQSESSLLRRFTTWITGSRPEFYHSTFVAQGKDRALTLVRSSGYVNVILNVVVKGIEP
jgi:hypothetical protein